MTPDPMTRLMVANPIVELPTIELPERLRCRIEDDTPTINLGEPRAARLSARRRGLVGCAAIAAASIAGVLLTAGSSGPGVNVAAAAYGAVSRAGIVEAVFVAHIFRGSQAGGTLRQREWNDAAAGLRRDQDTLGGPYGDAREDHVLEMSFAPGSWETWSAGREANVITRRQTPLDLKVNAGFGGIALDGVEGIELYRRLYREGLVRLVGHERHKGRVLWKLQSRLLDYDANGKRVAIQSHTRLVVLVDPKTFLPVSERQIDIALRGHPTVVESNLVSYRHLPAGEATDKLFNLAAVHPDAHVLMRSFTPRFRSQRSRGAAVVKRRSR